MRLLLDSHTLIGSQDDTRQLSAASNAALSNPGNDRLISAATVWEIAIKVGKGRLPLSKSFRVGMETATLLRLIADAPRPLLGIDC